MYSIIKLSSPLKYLPLSALIVIGSLLRWACSSRGYNLDIESWYIVAEIVGAGGNVYHETSRYNYAPIWSEIISQLNCHSFYAEHSIEALRYRVTFLLIVVDIGICTFLFLNYGLKVAILFFLNPISIIITGYHGQFDNLAILIGLISVWLYERADKSRLTVVPALFFLGLSLAVKHFLFLFPFWLALREKEWGKRLLILLIPYALFLGSFIFHIKGGIDGIVENVFLYRSFNNAPIWQFLLPDSISQNVSMRMLYFGSMLFIGYTVRKFSPSKIYFIYLISVVAFSSAITNQYLVIPVVAVAIFSSWPLFIYTFLGGFFLILNSDGLHLYNSEYLSIVSIQSIYELLCFMLVISLFYILRPSKDFLKYYARLRQKFATIWK